MDRSTHSLLLLLVSSYCVLNLSNVPVLCTSLKLSFVYFVYGFVININIVFHIKRA